MSILGSLNDNCQCIAHTLASGATITMTDVFPNVVNTVEIRASADITITFLYGAAAPAAAGNNTASVTGWAGPIGPSHAPAIIHAATASRTISIKNTGAVSADLNINGWQGVRLRN